MIQLQPPLLLDTPLLGRSESTVHPGLILGSLHNVIRGILQGGREGLEVGIALLRLFRVLLPLLGHVLCELLALLCQVIKLNPEIDEAMWTLKGWIARAYLLLGLLGEI